MVRTRKFTNDVTSLEGIAEPVEGVDSLQRGLEILRFFDARHRSLELSEIAHKLGLSRLTTAKLVATLTAQNFLRKSGEGERFEPHVASLSLGRAAWGSLDILHVTQPRMQRVAERFDVHVLLTTRDRLNMLVIDNRLPPNKARLGLSIGARFPITTSASGRAYLWAQPPETRAQLLTSLQAAEKDARFKRISDVFAAFQELEEQGWCFLAAPVTSQTSSIATPVRSGDATFVLAAMTVGEAAMERKLRHEVAPELLSITREIAVQQPSA